MTRSAVIILTHFYNDHIRAMFDRLRAESPSDHDIFIAINSGKEAPDFPAGAEDIADSLFLCNYASLLTLGYPGKCNPNGWNGRPFATNPGNADLIAHAFHRANPQYAYYWAMEYDVHFEGKWEFFFNRFRMSQADVLGTCIRKARFPNHVPMPPFTAAGGTEPNKEEAMQGYFPIFRLSKRMMDTIDQEYLAGWCGHYEMTFGTIAKLHSYEVEDFGGSGAFVKPHNRNSFYFTNIRSYTLSPGTFVFRPTFTKVLPRENTLWHPVKPTGDYRHWHAISAEVGFIKGLYYASKPTIWKIAIWLWFALIWRKAERLEGQRVD